MKKLILEDVRVESFHTTPADSDYQGTVVGHSGAVDCEGVNAYTIDTCDVSCQYGTCELHKCNTESINRETCDYTCGNNYGCATIDPRCTHGGVYQC